MPVLRESLGKLLVRRIDDDTAVSVTITEAEAYGPPSEDPLVRTEGAKGLKMNWEPGLAWGDAHRSSLEERMNIQSS